VQLVNDSSLTLAEKMAKFANFDPSMFGYTLKPATLDAVRKVTAKVAENMVMFEGIAALKGTSIVESHHSFNLLFFDKKSGMGDDTWNMKMWLSALDWNMRIVDKKGNEHEHSIWDEYVKQSTPEARKARAAEKAAIPSENDEKDDSEVTDDEEEEEEEDDEESEEDDEESEDSEDLSTAMESQ
jgi:hypothetical protein